MNSNIDTYLKKRSEKGIWKLNSLPKKSIYEFIICIPAYAEKDYILNTLNSIGDQDKKLLDRTMTIIVINNVNLLYNTKIKVNPYLKLVQYFYA